MRTGRPIPALNLTDGEREALQNWAGRPKSAQALALRARMILLCAEGNTKNGGNAWWTGGWTGYWMNHGRGRRAK